MEGRGSSVNGDVLNVLYSVSRSGSECMLSMESVQCSTIQYITMSDRWMMEDVYDNIR